MKRCPFGKVQVKWSQVGSSWWGLCKNEYPFISLLFLKQTPLGDPCLHIMRVYRQMSHLVASIEFLIRKYIETKFDYDALRHLTPALLETTLRRDEEATEDLSAELLRIVLDEVNWHGIVQKVKANIPDEECDDQDDEEDNDEEEINE